MEFQNKSSNVTKDNDAKEIELLITDLELAEDANTAIISPQDNSDPTVYARDDSSLTVSAHDDSDLTVSAHDDSDLTVSAHDDSDLTVSAHDDSDLTVSAHDDSDLTVSAHDDSDLTASAHDDSDLTVSAQEDSVLMTSTQDDSIATAKRDFYQLVTHLQKIAGEFKDSTFEKIYAGLLCEPMTPNLTGKEIYDLLIFALLNLAERNLKINEDSMRNFKELFGEMDAVLEYVKHTGTGHLSFENKKKVLVNLFKVRQETRYRISWLNRVQNDFESFLQFYNQIGIPVNFPHIKSAPVIAEKLKTFIIAMTLFHSELQKYYGNTSTVIERLKGELLTEANLFH
ncbi:unnamed protein product [Larinioides sclopetarius]|uniref:Uncharacterized protein n=1 Tax=Larinioides sclopetarius TaxID=280406 RepID=A0AAV1ZRN9_9ARAC